MRNIDAGGFVTLIKPFNMQVSRVLLYFLYFVAGNVIGMYGIERSFFALHIKGDNKVMNVFAKEAMGIYIIHYAVVTVLQYAFTFVALSAVIKGITTTLMTIIISLGLVVLTVIMILLFIFL